MRILAVVLSLCFAAPLVSQADIFIHSGVAGPTPGYSVPITRVIDIDGNGIYTPANELFPFQVEYHSKARKNCFIMGLATVVEDGRMAFYGADNGDSTSGESYLFRSVDLNGDGKINAGESVIFADFGKPTMGHSPDGVAVVKDKQGRSIAYVTNDAPGIQGLWRCQDLNQDGDALDTGECRKWAWSGAKLKLGALTLDLNYLNRMQVCPRGGVVAYNDADMNNVVGDSYAWLGFVEDGKGNPVVRNFFNSSTVNGLPRNVDFAAGHLIEVDLNYLSGPTTHRINDLVHGAVSPNGYKGQDAWYFATYCKLNGAHSNKNKLGQVISGLVFRGMDINQDGDLNDLGEITLFFNGSGAAAKGGVTVGQVKPVSFYDNVTKANTTLCDGIDGLSVVGDTVYVVYEPAPKSVAMLALQDKNNNRVIDSGEAKQVLWFTTPQPPVYSTKFGADVRGIVALPPGMVADPQPTGVTPYGIGCSGSNGLRPLVWTRGGIPVPGLNTFACHLSRGPINSAALLMLGNSKTSFASTTLPLDLGWFGMTGCSLYNNMVMVIPAQVDVNGRSNVTLPIPMSSALKNRSFYAQYIIADQPANSRGLTSTHAIQITVQ